MQQPQMRQLLRDLGFEFEDRDLDPIVGMLAGAHRQRVQAKKAIVEGEVTRTTAIAVLAQLEPTIEKILASAELDWDAFRRDIGLPGEIGPRDVADVDLHHDFETTLRRSAETYPGRPTASPLMLATSILRMVVEEPKVGLLGDRLREAGLDLESLQRMIAMPETAPEPDLRQAEPGTETPEVAIEEDEQKATEEEEETDEAEAEEIGTTDDPLIESLLSRRLAVSTLASEDVDGALSLIASPGTWGLGPEVEWGDILLIYFPKTLAGNKRLRDIGEQTSGLRFLLRAGSQSRLAGSDDNFNHVVDIDDRLELTRPLDPESFEASPLSEWTLPKMRFRGASREKEPLPRDLAHAL